MRMKPHLFDAFRIHLRDVNLGRVVLPMAAPLDAMLRLEGPWGRLAPRASCTYGEAGQALGKQVCVCVCVCVCLVRLAPRLGSMEVYLVA